MTDHNLPKGKEDLIELNGSVENIVFHNSDNGYTVCEISTQNDSYITAVGMMPFLSEGESINALGRWELNPTYGRQFKIEYYEKELPASESAILKYLSSGALKGIGKVLAKRIVERFGTDTFDVIEHTPDFLTDINGITPKKAKTISEQFRENFGVRSVMMFCRDFFGPSVAVKVYKTWGCAAVDIIKDNPYRLCRQVSGVSFETADKIAASLGIPADHPSRIESGISFFLNYQAFKNGHTFIPYDRLVPAATGLLSVNEDVIRSSIRGMLDRGDAVSVKFGGREVIYLKSFFEAERYIASKLTALDRLCEHISVDDTDRFIGQLEAELDIKYASLQRKAISDAINNGVMILTGGPGTGKTTVIRAVITVFERMGLEIVLAAPTGRAAKRMSDATGHEAKTVHRLLETDFHSGEESVFRRDENDMLDEDVIIIDEASMLDTLLMSSLLKAVKPGARLMLIGDADQLPSVGAGYVLSDILTCGCFHSVRLTEIFRQSEQSRIVTNAHAINNGVYPDLTTVPDGDFFFMRRNDEKSAADTVVQLCAERLPKKYGEQVLNGIQVITPSHKGATGTDYLNALLQNALNPPSPLKAEKKLKDTVFRTGDKVMQVKNNYDIRWSKGGQNGQGIFNGDIGVICEINCEEETLDVDFDGKLVTYPFSSLDELEHAYAITVHKSQGCEYPIVILPVCGCSPRLLTRNLLYTAVTRAKDMVIAVGSEAVINGMVDNDKQIRRYTGLSFFFKNYTD